MPRKSDPSPPLPTEANTEELRLRETARERFRRMAPKRVNLAINRINLVGNLASQKHYESTPEEETKILAAITQAVDDMRRRFARVKEPPKHFSLD